MPISSWPVDIVWVDSKDYDWIDSDSHTQIDTNKDNNMATQEFPIGNIQIPRELPFATDNWDGPLHKTIDVVDLGNMTITVNAGDLATIVFTTNDPNFGMLVSGQVIKILFPKGIAYIVVVSQVVINQAEYNVRTTSVEGNVVAILTEGATKIDKEELPLLGRKLRL
jgi:hypothetical protein